MSQALTRGQWLQREDRRRRLLSWAAALLVYVLAGGALLVNALLGRETFSENGGPLLVRIGSPEGLDETSTTLPALKAGSLSGVTPPPSQAPVLPTSPAFPPSATAKTDSGLATASVSPKTSSGAPAPAQGKAPPAAQVPSIGQPGGQETGLPGGSASGSGDLSLKGVENGNSFETSIGGGGNIRRSLGVPLSLYMPPPLVLPAAIYDGIKPSVDGFFTVEQRRLQFRSVYEALGSSWRLKADLPLDARPGLWLLLADAGYDLSRAEYKSRKDLKPVVLDFELSAPRLDERTKAYTVDLQSVTLVSSSGDKAIDDIVVYAFKKGSYSNDTNRVIKARFTYTFN